MPIVVGIETTCDETSVGIVEFLGQSRKKNKKIPQIRELSLVILSQEIHSKYGGVVPELASRSHLDNILSVFREAVDRAGIKLQDIDLISVANGPGLPGSLMVGVNFAKGLAQALSKKIIMVNHVEAHIVSPLIENDIPFPFFSLIVSGGHTSLYLVRDIGNYELLLKTQDDAAGEAFDKIAKIFRLPYPGGPVIDSLSQGKEPIFYFPDVESEDFSFSGLKTFCIRTAKNWFGPFPLPEFLASAQKKIVDEIFRKTVNKVSEISENFPEPIYIAITGGVARNSYMRSLLLKADGKIKFVFPHPRYCMDNGTMIAFLGGLRNLVFGQLSDLKEEINPTYRLKPSGGIG